MEESSKRKQRQKILQHTGLLLVAIGVFVVWLLVDYATKHFFDAVLTGKDPEGLSNFVGLTLGYFLNNDVNSAYFAAIENREIIFGLLRLTLVHNTGIAWGIFQNNSLALGWISLAICSGFLLLLIKNRKHVNAGFAIGAAIVLAGGVGNAFERLIAHHVIDFLEFTFIPFPVFNIADIGVVCGIILMLISYYVGTKKSGTTKRGTTKIKASIEEANRV